MIRAFVSLEYWSIDAELNGKKPPLLRAHLAKLNGTNVEKTINTQDAAYGIVSNLEDAEYVVQSVTNREKRRNAVPPFITSTLQQEASRKLRYSVKRAMGLAQRLYEGVELGKEGSVGLITYMRTDSTRVSADALSEVRELIGQRFGKEYLPGSPNVYKTKKDAQDAHEAIRPTSAMRTPESVEKYLQEDELKLYRLIWMRFVASQMAPAVFDQTTIDVQTKGKDGTDYLFGGFGDDSLYGDAGTDILHGDVGSDYLTGGSGIDSLDGGDGNDVFHTQDNELDYIHGGAGWDTAVVDNKVWWEPGSAQDDWVDVESVTSPKLVTSADISK